MQPGARRVRGLQGDQRPVDALRALAPVERRHRFTAEQADLERALDALRVQRRQAGSGLRIQRGQPRVHRGPAVAGGLGIELRAQRRIGLRQLGQAVEQRLEIKHRAADQQRPRAAGLDLGHQAQRVADELRRRVARGRLEDVDQVMRHRGEFFRRRLGGADVHAAVHQRGVDADDLHRLATRDRERGRRLAAARRPGEAQRPQRRWRAGRGGSGRCGRHRRRFAQKRSQGAR